MAQLGALTVFKMKTITCEEKQIKVKEIEQIGGELNATTDFLDTLYFSRDGRYFLNEERQNPISPNSSYQWPRDRALIERMQNKEISVKQISERDAMKWFVLSFMNESKLKKRFVNLVERFAD
jgi:hypothetical protein